MGDGRNRVERLARRAADDGALQRAARAGFFAKAVVYGTIALLALGLALGWGGAATDTRGALGAIAREPLGRALVAVLTVGVAALGLWLVLEAIADPDRSRRGALGGVMRAGEALAGLAYGSLAYWGARLVLGAGGAPTGNAAARSLTARVLEAPLGPVWVALAGALVAFVGLRQIRNGVRRTFEESLDLGRMSPRERRWATRLGVPGFTAQGAVFALVGVFLVQAALERQPHEATGFDGALLVLARHPFGPALLGVTALGLLAYAAYALLEGAHRRLGR
jgi:hypothetical protein